MLTRHGDGRRVTARILPPKLVIDIAIGKIGYLYCSKNAELDYMSGYRYDPTKPIQDEHWSKYGVPKNAENAAAIRLKISRLLGKYAEAKGWESLQRYEYVEKRADFKGGCDFVIRRGSKKGPVIRVVEIKTNDAELTVNQTKCQKYCQSVGIPFEIIRFNVPPQIVNMINKNLPWKK